MYKCDVTCSLPPPPCHKLSHLLGPPPHPSSVTYFMDGPQSHLRHWYTQINSISSLMFLDPSKTELILMHELV